MNPFYYLHFFIHVYVDILKVLKYRVLRKREVSAVLSSAFSTLQKAMQASDYRWGGSGYEV